MTASSAGGAGTSSGLPFGQKSKEKSVKKHAQCVGIRNHAQILPWTKKRTIIEIRGEKNAVPRVISCSIRRDQRRASPIRVSVLLAANLDDGSFFCPG